METFFITCNGNLINYKAKKACNAQLLFHYILITLHLFFDISFPTLQQHLLTDNKLMDILRIHCNFIVVLKFSFVKASRLYVSTNV